MSVKLQGKIHRYKLIEFARVLKVEESDNLLRVAKHLLLALAEHFNDKSGQCNPSIERLAKFIERSKSATIVAMNLLKKLGIVVVLKNAKGGRGTPWYSINFPRYEEFSHPESRIANSPLNNTPQYNQQHSIHTVSKSRPSVVQETTHLADRTRIPIEPLDEPLIKTLLNGKNNDEDRNAKLLELATKYGFILPNKYFPFNNIEIYLQNLIFQNGTKNLDRLELDECQNQFEKNAIKS